MEKGKYKKFLTLSQRHKRRRLSTSRVERSNSLQNHYDSGSDSTSAEDIPPIHFPLQTDWQESDSESRNSDDPQFAAVDQDILSSNEGSSVEERFHVPPVQQEEGEYVERGSTSEEDVREIPPALDLIDMKMKAIKNAFLASNLKHTQCNILLKTLREFPINLNFLPKDARTILQTPTIVATTLIQRIAGGEYLHLGFKITLEKKLKSIPVHLLPEKIVIDFSTDGGKANKGVKSFWPLQYRIFNIPNNKPIIAGVFLGKQKPTNAYDFFEQFLHEIVQIRDEGGIFIIDRRIPLSVRCFIADAPARAFALNHYGHNSSKPCSKCKVEGRYYMGRMIFEGIRHPLRTDEEYRNLTDEDHHKGRSPLSEILDLVTQVPLEGMHLVWIGNVKKVILANVEGKFLVRRLSGRKMNIVNCRMIELGRYCPSEFNRRPTELSLFHNFKATEFRQIALYTAPSILRNVFQDDCYKHFLILHSVMRMLVCKETPLEMLIFCQHALESYVVLCEELYGSQFISYNVHCLLHVVADVQKLGDLESFSAFSYENSMPEFRKQIHKPDASLQQYYKRLSELSDFTCTPVDNNIRIRLSIPHAEGPLPEDIPVNVCRQFRKLKIGHITYATSLRDSCCILQNSSVCIINNIIQIEEEIFFILQEFQRKYDVYDVGITSDVVGVYRCTNLVDIIEAVPLNEEKGKCYRMPYWSDVEGEEERALDDQCICVSLLSGPELPDN